MFYYLLEGGEKRGWRMKRYSVFVILLSLTVISITSAQPVYFADSNLKAAVETKLGVTNPTQADMLNLTYLSAFSQGITDLTG